MPNEKPVYKFGGRSRPAGCKLKARTWAFVTPGQHMLANTRQTKEELAGQTETQPDGVQDAWEKVRPKNHRHIHAQALVVSTPNPPVYGVTV